ncbi:hypothetical protein CEXT_608351 [Caerostris extrusa]|uniref:Uncharacterized protein n=1 Tax=Caerostris extrusa TaxID=172846 RepID=A0AAV4TA13_CAEEX|nr:hypothetical protein CEXT_608351 [Caerostris extrusa]
MTIPDPSSPFSVYSFNPDLDVERCSTRCIPPPSLAAVPNRPKPHWLIFTTTDGHRRRLRGVTVREPIVVRARRTKDLIPTMDTILSFEESEMIGDYGRQYAWLKI